MTDKKELIKELIRNKPNLSGNEIYKQIKGTPLGIRKQTFQEIFRETKSLPEPTIQKRDTSIPKKFKTAKTRIQVREKAKKRIEVRAKLKSKKEPEVKPKKERIPFEKTKFGKMSKTVQTVFKISERNANERLRDLLKIPRDDYGQLNKKDLFILEQHGY